MRHLVTGAMGSVGQALLPRLDGVVCATDVEYYHSHLDVTDREEVFDWVRSTKPDVIFHLAGAKHAPEGELDPSQVSRVNIDGTLNVIAAAKRYGGKVILSSTCKACDPETAYGASKLIAERAVLNDHGVVVRFHNIPESSGNVFRIWEDLPPDAPLPVTDCWRYFTPMKKAVELLLAARDLPSGRYAWHPGEPLSMAEVAAATYPGRPIVTIPARRGDRRREPLVARCETISMQGEWMHIRGAHDRIALPVAA